MTMLLLAAIAFVGTHFLLSHPLRAPLARAAGERAFLGVYSAVTSATVLMLIASVLLAGSFAIWGLAHILVYPTAKTIIVAAAIMLLSLAGAALQDKKKERLQPDAWPAWEGQTSYIPFAAIAAGRVRLGGFGPIALLGSLVLWLAATWAHMPLSGWPAGIWRWL